ncbi:MAG TPA: sugar ABC transporter ATP-binding protein [Chloroflexota bacterium]|nr:sugar ABC transporter ATP-binding protein [Chloroflexota bacterium]
MGNDSGSLLLRLSQVWKRYGGIVALKDVSLDVVGGEVHALLGENGAGKSTLMGIASGSIRPDAGTIDVAGQHIAEMTPALARRLGLAIVHQHPALLPDLTVAENMRIAVAERLGGGQVRGKLLSQLRRVGCLVDMDERVEELSVAQRHLVEIAKALAIEPRILILDEPTAPLGADRIAQLFEEIRAAAGRGTAIIYITHRLAEMRQIADRVTVLRDGEVRGTSLVGSISDDEILRLIIGRSVSTVFPPKGVSSGEGQGGLVAESMSGDGFHDVNLRVSPGEIVGLAGIAGNGQSDVLRALAGLAPASGQARLGDTTLRLNRPQAARAAGVAYLSADRQSEGLLMSLSVRENAALSALSQFAYAGVVQRGAEVAGVEKQRKALAIKAATIEAVVSALSGGNQQKVALARSLLAQPKLILADEPTQGVDAGARVEIYRILREAANSGIPVLVVSSDTLELEGLCDRIVVFSRGHIIGELSGADITEEKIAQSIITATTHRRDDAEMGGKRR